MKKSRDYKSRNEIGQEARDQGKETEKLLKTGDTRARNSERLSKGLSEVTGNLPKAERDRLKKEAEKAVQQGVKDFEKTKKEMEKHLNDEEGSRKEFSKAEKDTDTDKKKVAGIQKEVKEAPFSRDLKQMEKELETVSGEFKKAGTAMEKDISKGKKGVGDQEQRVKRATPKLKF